jgi:hypothetical protein
VAELILNARQLVIHSGFSCGLDLGDCRETSLDLDEKDSSA